MVGAGWTSVLGVNVLGYRLRGKTKRGEKIQSVKAVTENGKVDGVG